ERIEQRLRCRGKQLLLSTGDDDIGVEECPVPGDSDPHVAGVVIAALGAERQAKRGREVRHDPVVVAAGAGHGHDPAVDVLTPQLRRGLARKVLLGREITVPELAYSGHVPILRRSSGSAYCAAWRHTITRSETDHARNPHPPHPLPSHGRRPPP